MSTSVASLTTNFFPSAQNGFTTTTSGSVASGATTVGLNSVSGYTNGEIATFIIDPTDTTKKQTFTGVIDTSGVQVTSVVWTAGTNQTHASGATVVDYASATHISQMTKGILVEHNQDGTHDEALITSRTADTAPASGDFILTSDVSASNALKKVTIANLFSNIPDGSITPADITSGTGTTWAWSSWTPTWTNVTVGDGTVTAKYIQIGKTVFYRLSLVLGSTSSVSGAISFSPPVNLGALVTSANSPHVGRGNILDTGTATYDCMVAASSTSSFLVRAFSITATYLRPTTTSGTVPMTWASGDELDVFGFYEVA